jgi:glucose-1-phosphate thymidylyltransferase
MKKIYKGILLAGGSGSRLFPITRSISKQLLNIYDKPMVYYSLSLFFLANIRDILLISTPKDIERFKALLGNGDNFGVSINYRVQNSPDGLAQSFLLGKNFIKNDNVSLVLGDNIFFGENLSSKLINATLLDKGATIFAYQVKDPEKFGVINFNKNGKVKSIQEKPKKPKSNYAVTGLYFYDNDVIEIAKKLIPSDRGELEISDVNNEYLKRGDLNVNLLGRGFAWLDTGSPASLLEAGNFVSTIESRQGFKIACLEEISFKKGWIDQRKLENSINLHKTSDYGKYLSKILEDYNDIKRK